MKRCFRCGQEKPINDFYTHANAADGHFGKCKDCTKDDVRVNRQSGPRRGREYDRRRTALPHRVTLHQCIVIDVETCACPDVAGFLDPVKAPSNYKDEAKIAAYCQEAQTKQVEKAALEPDLCEVVAVGFRHPEYANASAVYTRADGDEAGLLTLLWDAIDIRAVVGFNVLGFDLPVLIRRSQLLNVRYPILNLDRYRTPHVDLLERLTFNGKLTYRSLAFYCRRFGIPCDDLTTGAQIADLVAANDWLGVKAHCRSDVDKTTALALRLEWLVSAAEPVAVP